MSRTLQETLLKVRDGSWDTFEGLGRVEEPFRRCRTGLGTLQEVRDGSETLRGIRKRSVDPPRDPGRVGGP